MASVMTLVTAAVDPERIGAAVEAYEATLDEGLPPSVAQTFFLRGDDDRWGIATFWRSREDLDRMLASTAEPLARRLLREAGGMPQVEVFEVVAGSLDPSR